MKEYVVFFEMTAMIFLSGFIIGSYVSDYSRKRYEQRENTGHLVNISTALWSLMNNGVKVRQVKKKAKPLITTVNGPFKVTLPKPEVGKEIILNKPSKINLELDMLKKAGMRGNGSEFV